MFHYKKTIIESDLDFYGHVNNARYLSLFEEARWDLVTKHGLGFEEINRSGIGFVVLRADLQFKKELKNRENIIIHTDFTSKPAKVMTLQQTISKEDGSTACIGDLTFGLFNLKTRKLVEPPPAWVAIMDAENSENLD